MFGSLLGKLARGETLSPDEVVRIEQYGNIASANVSGSGSQQTNVDVFNFTAQHGQIEFPIVSYFMFARSQSSQTIGTTAVTPIQWDTQNISPSGNLVYSTAQPERIKFRGSPSGHHIVLAGHVIWEASSVGYRTVAVNNRNSAGVSIGGQTLSQVAPASGIETAQVYFMVFNYDELADHVTIDVLQNTAGNLGLQYARLQSWWVD